MGTTADKLALLMANKEAIRDAITEKTGEDAGEVMSTYAEKIMGIQTGPEYWRTTILLDQTITDPATMITKVYDDGGIGLIRANSHRYVCKLVDGVMQAKQLQDGNGTLYVDGTTADLTGAEGDVMMKLPEFYYRARSEETDKWYIDFVYGGQPDDSYKHWDGKDFIGVYEAYVADSNVYSRSGVTPSANISQIDFKAYARNRGEGYTLVKWKHHCIMAFLFYAEYLNTNSQAICGAGTSAQKNTGQTDLLGMEDTRAGVNGDTQSINFFGLENWWGNKFEWVDNVVADNRVWSITEDDESVRMVSAGLKDGYISTLLVGEYLDATPTAALGTADTGLCDYYVQNNNVGLVVTRSNNLAVPNGGISYVGTYAPSNGGTGDSSRLAYRGEYEEFDGVFGAEYILNPFTSGGTKYFDTGFKHNQDTRVVMRIKTTSPTGSTAAFAFDGHSNNDTRKGVMSTDGVWFADYTNTDDRKSFEEIPADGEFNIDFDKNVCTINGVSQSFTASTFQSKINLYLLCRNNTGTAGNPINATLYSCQIYDNGTLIRDYVPCVRKSDGVSGLWDKVNKTFNTPITIA